MNQVCMDYVSASAETPKSPHQTEICGAVYPEPADRHSTILKLPYQTGNRAGGRFQQAKPGVEACLAESREQVEQMLLAAAEPGRLCDVQYGRLAAWRQSNEISSPSEEQRCRLAYLPGPTGAPNEDRIATK